MKPTPTNTSVTCPRSSRCSASCRHGSPPVVTGRYCFVTQRLRRTSASVMRVLRRPSSSPAAGLLHGLLFLSISAWLASSVGLLRASASRLACSRRGLASCASLIELRLLVGLLLRLQPCCAAFLALRPAPCFAAAASAAFLPASLPCSLASVLGLGRLGRAFARRVGRSRRRRSQRGHRAGRLLGAPARRLLRRSARRGPPRRVAAAARLSP